MLSFRRERAVMSWMHCDILYLGDRQQNRRERERERERERVRERERWKKRKKEEVSENKYVKANCTIK